MIALDAQGSTLSRSCDVIAANLRTTSARDHQKLQDSAAELAALDSQLNEMVKTAATIKRIPNVTETDGVDRLVRPEFGDYLRF